MGYKLLIHEIFWGYNPFTNSLRHPSVKAPNLNMITSFSSSLKWCPTRYYIMFKYFFHLNDAKHLRLEVSSTRCFFQHTSVPALNQTRTQWVKQNIHPLGSWTWNRVGSTIRDLHGSWPVAKLCFFNDAMKLLSLLNLTWYLCLGCFHANFRTIVTHLLTQICRTLTRNR